MLWEWLFLGRRMGRFEVRLRDALAEPTRPWSELGCDALVGEFRRLERRLITRWDASLINDLFTMIFFGAFRAVCERWIDRQARHLPGALVAGHGSLASAEPARRIREMAQSVARDPTFRAALEELLVDAPGPVDFARWPAFQSAWEDYLARFGDRCMQELKLESRSLRDNPRPLLAGVLQAAACVPLEQAADASNPDEGSLVRQALRGHPVRRLVFH